MVKPTSSANSFTHSIFEIANSNDERFVANVLPQISLTEPSSLFLHGVEAIPSSESGESDLEALSEVSDSVFLCLSP